MLKISNLFKNIEYEALFRFAYAPERFVNIDDFNFDDFDNEIISVICKDVRTDFKYGLFDRRFKRRPIITFKECFKSEEHMVVFFLIFADDFLNLSHGCGNDFKENILKITEETEDITELAVAWKRKMFYIIDNLEDLSKEQEVLAKTSVVKFWNYMNISEAPEEDLEDLAYID